MRRPLAWLLAFTLQVATGAALAAPQLQAWPAWQGLARVGQASVVQLRLQAYPAGQVLLATTTASHRFEHSIEAAGGAALELQLPFVADVSGRVTVTAAYADGSTSRQQLLLQLVEPVQPLRVSALHMPAPPYLASAPAGLLHVAPEALPQLALGYAGVTSMVLDSATLNQLLPAQRRALRDFVAACGRLYLLNTSTAQTRELQRYAGCGAETVAAFTDWQQASTVASPRLQWSRDAVSALARLASAPSHPALLPVVLLLSGYLLGLLLMLGFQAPRHWLLGWVLLITILALGGWWQRPPLRTTLSWSEMQVDEPVAQTLHIVEVAGLGRWRGELELAEPATAPQPLPANPDIISIALQDRGMALQLATHLFSRQQLSYQHSRFMEPGLELGLRAARPYLVNHGHAAMPAAVLWWDGSFYATPKLAPGAQWQLGDDSTIAGAQPALQMMHQRLGAAQLALLLDLEDDASPNTHWLLLRADAPDAGPGL